MENLKTSQNAQHVLNSNRGKIISVGHSRIYVLTEAQQAEEVARGDWLTGEYIMIPDTMTDAEALESYGEKKETESLA